MPDTLKVITRNCTLESLQVTRVLDRIPDLNYSLLSPLSNSCIQTGNLLPGNGSPDICPRGPDQVILEGEADLVIQSTEDLPFRNQYGKITLVGFGPGNPDLLTLGGDKALAQSDIIFHDDLLDKEYLKKYSAEKVYVGKRKGSHCVEQSEINRLILDAARAGKKVVRLKGGDPMVFAHGGEEIEYLERNLMEVEVIPGVSSGIAVASLLKVPLTHRGIASSVAFISGHTETVHLPDADTLVIYMGGSNIQAIARKAIEQGRNPEMPVMMVSNLSLPDQQEFFFTLNALTLTDQKFPTPIIIVIGEVVSFRNKSATELLKNNDQVTVVPHTCHFYEL